VTRTADVVIIGGGVTGTSLVYHLARRGVKRILVLERRFLASGGTGRSIGIIRQLYPTPEATRMVHRSLHVFRHFTDLVGGESGYVPCGALIGLSQAMLPALRKTMETRSAIGIRAELLAPAEASRIEPRINSEGLELAGGTYVKPEP
jgi:glycine/D-amino acid oxidase-like deaminating enzyme